MVRKVEQRGQELVAFIETGLREKVYTDVDVISVENCRKLLDVRNQALRLKEHGSVKISSLHYKTFRDTSLFFEPELDKRLDPDDMRLQWKLFNEVLEEVITIHINLSSLDILKLLLNPKKGKFKGIEGVLSVLVRAAVAKGGVESVCESMVGVMEAHTPSLRAILDQRRLEDELLVAWNGEDVYHCEAVVKEALGTYWGQCKSLANREGHFIRRSENIESYVTSEAVDSQANKPAKLSFMTQ